MQLETRRAVDIDRLLGFTVDNVVEAAHSTIERNAQ